MPSRDQRNENLHFAYRFGWLCGWLAGVTYPGSLAIGLVVGLVRDRADLGGIEMRKARRSR